MYATCTSNAAHNAIEVQSMPYSGSGRINRKCRTHVSKNNSTTQWTPATNQCISLQSPSIPK